MISPNKSKKLVLVLALLMASFPLFSMMRNSIAGDFIHLHMPKPHSHLHSQWREKGEEYEHAKQRYFDRLGIHPESAKADKKSGRSTASLSHASAVDSAREITALDVADIPDWSNVTNYEEIFDRFRDARFLTDPDHTDPSTRRAFARRSTWLYPDDGCFARAALMGQNIQKMGLPRPAKVFIFGQLEVQSTNSTTGTVTWWYHVVNIVKINGQPIVFDPSIQAQGPMSLIQWVDTMTPDRNSVKISICSPETYTPNSSCSGSNDEVNALRDQDGFLDSEWERQNQLGRNPFQVLGNNPPWTL